MGIIYNTYKRARDIFCYKTNNKPIQEEPVTLEFQRILYEIGLEADNRRRGSDIPPPAYFYNPYKEGLLERILKKI